MSEKVRIPFTFVVRKVVCARRGKRDYYADKAAAATEARRQAREAEAA